MTGIVRPYDRPFATLVRARRAVENRLSVRIFLMLQIVGQDGIDHEALKEVEESAHSGEGLCREVIMGRVKGQNAPNFCLI